MEKCFKLHGFPPGFKPKGKTSMANQVGVQDDLAENGQSEAMPTIIDYARQSDTSYCSPL